MVLLFCSVHGMHRDRAVHAAPVTELLWGTTLSTCSGATNAPANATDRTWGTWGWCEDDFGSGTAWEYVAIDDPTSAQALSAISLDIAFAISGFDAILGRRDTVSIEISNDDGTSWFALDTVDADMVQQTRTYDVFGPPDAVLTTRQHVVDARIRFSVVQRGTRDTLRIELDEILLTIDGDDSSPPVAHDDAYGTPQNAPLTVAAPGVLGNDTDVDGDPLTAILDTDTSDGVLVLNVDGSFAYTPDPGFAGTDSFAYLANDGIQNSIAPATVTIAVSFRDPHGGYIATTDECARCHRAHTAAGPHLVASFSPGNAFCHTCHDDGGAGSSLAVSTHSNIDFAPRIEEDFELACIQCHEPHGSANLFGIRTDVIWDLGPPRRTLEPAVVFVDITEPTDDYDADGTTGLCIQCHLTAGDFATHAGGASHASGGNYEGTRCTICHAHNADSDWSTRDGFLASGGTCIGCHRSATDWEGVGPIDGRRAVVGEFGATSHHAGAVTDADCEVCHDEPIGHPADGFVSLKNADSSASTYTEGTPGDYRPTTITVGDSQALSGFCLSCHDVDGAGGDITPFADNITVPIIDDAAWAAASHNGLNYGCLGNGSTGGCHDTGHGSNKVALLAAADHTGDGDPDDPMMQEERFCYTCHDADGPSSYDIASQFAPATRWIQQAGGSGIAPDPAVLNMNDRHDIAATDQAASGAVVECVDCHDPHRANAAKRLVADPDPLDGRIPGTGYFTDANFYTDWCADCHDGSYPSAAMAPTVPLIDVLAVYALSGDQSEAHGLGDGNAALDAGYGYADDMVVQCLDCHVRHVSGGTPSGVTNLFHTKVTVMSRDGLTPVPDDNGTFDYELSDNLNTAPDATSGYDWCNTCHQSSMRSPNCWRCHVHGIRQ